MKKAIMLLSFVLLLACSNMVVYAIGPANLGVAKTFGNVELKTSLNFGDAEIKYLVSYDSLGNDEVENIKITVKKNSVVITPSVNGWSPQTTYFIIRQTKLNKGIIKLKYEVLARFVGAAQEFVTVAGKVKLPDNERAFEETGVLVEIFPIQEMKLTSAYTQIVKLTQNTNSEEYHIRVPKNMVGYGIRYSLYRLDPKLSYLNELSSEYYYSKGYFNRMGSITGRQDIVSTDIGIYHFRRNTTKDIVLVRNSKVVELLDKLVDGIIDTHMTDYQKELAIYECVKKSFHFDNEFYNLIKDSLYNEDWNPDNAARFKELLSLEHILQSRITICSGYAKLMKVLLNREGIECEIVTGTSRDGQHAWNIAKIEGKYYQLDATFDSGFYESDIMEETNEWLNMDDQIAAKDHFNPTINGSTPPVCDSLDYNFLFHSYWEDNGQQLGNLSRLTGKVTLPDGQKAPKGGMVIGIRAMTGNDTDTRKDDFMNITKVTIPENASSAEYSTLVIPSQNSYQIVSTNSSMIYGMDKVMVDSTGKKEYDIQLGTVGVIKGRIKLPQNAEALKDDMMVIVFLKYPNAGTIKKNINSFYYDATTVIEKQKREATFELPQYFSDLPYTICYEIVNADRFTNYEQQAFYGANGSVLDPTRSDKVIVNQNLTSLELTLLKK